MELSRKNIVPYIILYVKGNLWMNFDFSTLVTDRTQADAAARNDKGTYRAADLNRVTEALEDLESSLSRLEVYILHLDGTTDTVWWEDDEDIRADRIEAYRANVASIRGAFTQLAATPQTPADLELLTWAEANDIERILQAVDDSLRRMALSRWYSGEIYSGEATA